MGRRMKLIILVATFVVVSGSVIIMGFLPYLATGSVINRHIDYETVYVPEDWGLEVKPLFLETKDGYRLAAWDVESEDPRAVVIFLGGLTQPPVSAFWGHARLLAEHGYNSLLIELRSHGESSGEQAYLGYAEHLDVLAGIDYVKEHYPNVPIIACGADLGGVAAINAAGLYSGLAGIISIGAFSSWADLFADNLYFSGAPLAFAVLEKPFVNLYTLLKFGPESRALVPKRQISNLGSRPALLMHAKDDPFVSVLNLERIIESLRGKAEHLESWIRPGDDHLVSSDFLHPENDPEYTERILSFLERHF
ncbi:MAG TPA: alpha/beta fold hydrolase [Limnochordia bacterium]|nr:alpha/beta fold hydrolase [Limnochordia bacterium]